MKAGLPTVQHLNLKAQSKHCCTYTTILCTSLPGHPPTEDTRTDGGIIACQTGTSGFDLKPPAGRVGTNLLQAEGRLGRPSLHSSHHNDGCHAVGLSVGVLPTDDHAISVLARSDVIVVELLMRARLAMIAFHVAWTPASPFTTNTQGIPPCRSRNSRDSE